MSGTADEKKQGRHGVRTINEGCGGEKVADKILSPTVCPWRFSPVRWSRKHHSYWCKGVSCMAGPVRLQRGIDYFIER